MTIESDARAIFAEVRQFFKGTIKSLNKTYVEGLADAEKCMKTKNRLDRYNLLHPRPLREYRMQVSAKREELKQAHGSIPQVLWGYTRAQLLKTVYDSADKQFVAGNCGEMGVYVFWCVIEKNISWDTCLVQIGGEYVNHAFCCMGDMTPFKDYAFNDLKNIAMDPGTIPWVIDPWANCCSPLNGYSDALAKKMAKWNDEGKRILAPLPSSPYESEKIEPNNYVARCLGDSPKIKIALSIGSRGEGTHS